MKVKIKAYFKSNEIRIRRCEVIKNRNLTKRSLFKTLHQRNKCKIAGHLSPCSSTTTILLT